MFQVDGDFSAMPEQLVIQDENFLAMELAVRLPIPCFAFAAKMTICL